MKLLKSVSFLLLAFSSSLCWAQTDQATITSDFKPSTLNQPGQEYPESTRKVMHDSALLHHRPTALR